MKRSHRSLNMFVLGAVVVTAGFLIGQVFSVDTVAEPVADGQTGDQGVPIRADGSSIFADVAERVGPAVVFIRTERSLSGSRREQPFDFFREMFPDQDDDNDRRRPRRIPGGGSGFIFDREGRILTNYHVIKDAEEITVVIEEDDHEKEFDAEVVGYDRHTDIAIIQIEMPQHIDIVPLGNSESMRVGDWVMAIGTPFGQLQGSVTVGVVSAKGRNDLQIVGGEADYQNYIQTDASINFGNSGGPLVNMKGEAVGINTAINPSGQGIGFAIPINMAKRIMSQLIEKGTVKYGFLGIQLRELDRTMAQGLGLDIEQGILVQSVLPNTPASRAGLEQRDVIVEYNGEPVRDDAKFRLMVGNTPIGTEVPLVIMRDGRQKSLNVTLVERRDEELIAEAEPEGDSDAWLGLRVDNSDRRSSRGRMNDDEVGVVVLEVEAGSPADEAGIREGDVITEVYSQSVSNLQDYQKVAEKLKNREDPIAFLVKRGRSTTYIPVIPGKR